MYVKNERNARKYTYLHEKVHSVLKVCQPLRKNQIKSFLIIRYPTAPLKKHEIVFYFALNIVFIFNIFFFTILFLTFSVYSRS